MTDFEHQQLNITEQDTVPIPEGSLDNPIVDSRYTREEAIESMVGMSQVVEANPERRKNILERQEIVRVRYLSADQKIHEGQIIVDRDLAQDVGDLFAFLLAHKFTVHSVIPIAKYGGQDEESMLANNSSGFNYRYIKDTDRLSLHAFGFAIDINPRQNPVQKDGITIQPNDPSIVRDLGNPNTLTLEHKVVKWLKRRGWVWGGQWLKPYQDYQHFEKPLPTAEYVDQFIKRVLNNPELDPVELEKRISTVVQNSMHREHADNAMRLVETALRAGKISGILHNQLQKRLERFYEKV